MDDYLATLGRNMRRDLRRKRKAFAGVRVERRRNIDDLAAEVYALYCQTVANSELQFEHLPQDYFPPCCAIWSRTPPWCSISTRIGCSASIS